MKRHERPELLLNIIVLVVAIILILVFLEIAARAVFGSNLKYTYTNDTLWELEPDQQGLSVPNGKFATINSAGFRGEEIALEKPANTERIVMLGGSIGFGWGVSDDETLSYQLEKALREEGKSVQVLNLGEAAYGLSQMFAKYDKIGYKYSPDVVVILFSPTNVLAQPETGDDVQVRSMLARKVLRSSTLAAILKPRLEFMRKWITGTGQVNSTDFLTEWPNDRDRIIEFNERLKDEGIVLVLLPYDFNEEHAIFYDTISSFGEENNILVTDAIYPTTKEYIEAYGRDEMFIDRGHPSAEQYRLSSQVVAKTVSELV